MSRPVYVRRRCEAIMANRFQCGNQAKWWVRRIRGDRLAIEARCAGHARHYSAAFPMATGDPAEDETRAALA